MTSLNMMVSLLLYGLCMYAYGPVSALAGPIAGILLTWAGAAALVQSAWTGNASPLAPLWHTLMVAGVLGIAAFYAGEVLGTGEVVPAPMAQMHVLMVLAVCPMMVTGGPMLRWVWQRYA